MIIKLDMSKAYDRVSRFYLIKLYIKMGFYEVFVDLIWRLISINWCSILVNGKSHVFFSFNYRSEEKRSFISFFIHSFNRSAKQGLEFFV